MTSAHDDLLARCREAVLERCRRVEHELSPLLVEATAARAQALIVRDPTLTPSAAVKKTTAHFIDAERLRRELVPLASRAQPPVSEAFTEAIVRCAFMLLERDPGLSDIQALTAAMTVAEAPRARGRN